MVRLFLLPIWETAKLPPELCGRLFPKRMERSERFRQRDDALRCIGAGALTALVLGVKEEEIILNRWGKPFAGKTGVYFSLSHSGDYTLLASDDGEVGVDIEKNGAVSQGVARRAFAPDELRWMDEAPEERFYRLWTMKESVIKLDGRGFSLPPESFSVMGLINGGPMLTDQGEIFGHTELFHDCTLSVCALHPIERAPVRVFTAAELTALYKP